MLAARRAATHFGSLPAGAQIMILTPSGLSQPGFVTAGWCAYHWSTVGAQVAYSYLPFMPDAGGSCGQNSVNSNGTFDGFSILGGHEYTEAITDPLGGGWIDVGGAEIADKCAWHQLSNAVLGGSPFAVQSLWSNASDSCQSALARPIYPPVSTANGRHADFNGDGTKDVVNFQQGSDGSVFVALSTGSSLTTPARWNPWGAFCYTGGTPLVGDFNGDDRDDIACDQQSSDGALFVALSTGSGFSAPTRWNTWGPFCYAGSTPIAGHFSGTRIGGHLVDDVACMQQSSDALVFVATSTGSSFDPATQWDSWGPFCYAGGTPVAGDFNGDGRDDLACDQQSTDGALFVATSTGSVLNAPSRWNAWGPFCYTGSTPLAGDFNGDGRDDLVCDQQSTDGGLFVATTTGSVLNAPSRWNPWGPFCYSGMTARVTNLASASGGDGMVCFTQGTAGDVWFTRATGSAFGALARWNSWGPFSAVRHTPV
jgi:hypothetical protein